MFGAMVAELRCVNAFQKGFSGTEEGRRQGQVHVIDQPGAKVLPDGGNTTAQSDIPTVGSVHRPLERGVNAIGDKVESGAAVHLDRSARVVGKHKNRSVVRGIVAPPSLPNVVWPGAADRPEHVPANDPRADIVEAVSDEVVVNSGSAAILAKHLSKGARAEDPFVQRHAADAQWIDEILVGAGTVAIEGDRKAMDAEFGHKVVPLWEAIRGDCTTAKNIGWGIGKRQEGLGKV